MFDRQRQESLLREIIGEHERNLELERERLEAARLEEAKLRFSAEILEEHGEHEEAQRVRMQQHDAEHRVKAAEQILKRGERLLAIYRQKLEQLQREQ